MTPDEARAFWASKTEAEKVALAKTAPVVVLPWRQVTVLRHVRERCGGGVVATVDPYEGGTFTVSILRAGSGGTFHLDSIHPDADRAKAACDAKLRKLGYVLEDGE